MFWFRGMVFPQQKILNVSIIKNTQKNHRDLNASLLELAAKASVLAGKSPAPYPNRKNPIKIKKLTKQMAPLSWRNPKF